MTHITRILINYEKEPDDNEDSMYLKEMREELNKAAKEFRQGETDGKKDSKIDKIYKNQSSKINSINSSFSPCFSLILAASLDSAISSFLYLVSEKSLNLSYKFIPLNLPLLHIVPQLL